MFTKSEKLNCWPGVLKPVKRFVPPGVAIMEEGRAAWFEGGVDGGIIRALLEGLAGEGEVAK